MRWAGLVVAAIVCVVGISWTVWPLMNARNREQSLIRLATGQQVSTYDDLLRRAQGELDLITNSRNERQFSLANELASPSIIRALAARRWDVEAMTDLASILHGDRWKQATDQHDDQAAAMAFLGRTFALNCALLSIALDFGTPEEREMLEKTIIQSLHDARETWLVAFAQCMSNSPLLFRDEWIALLKAQAAGQGPPANAAKVALRTFDRLTRRSSPSPTPTPP